jgi:hypothetical protein
MGCTNYKNYMSWLSQFVLSGRKEVWKEMSNQEIIGCPRKKYLVLLRKDQKEMDDG